MVYNARMLVAVRSQVARASRHRMMGSWLLLLSRRLSLNYYFADGGCTASVHKYCMYDSPVYENTPGALKEKLLCNSLLASEDDRDFMHPHLQ